MPEILNFASRRSLKNDEIIESVSKLLPVEIQALKDLDKQRLNRKERMIATGMSFTGVYAKINLKFDTANLEKTISVNGNEITTKSLHRMIEYFVNAQSKKAVERSSS